MAPGSKVPKLPFLYTSAHEILVKPGAIRVIQSASEISHAKLQSGVNLFNSRTKDRGARTCDPFYPGLTNSLT